MKENELIELLTISEGTSFQAGLYYSIYNERLCIIKKPYNNLIYYSIYNEIYIILSHHLTGH